MLFCKSIVVSAVVGFLGLGLASSKSAQAAFVVNIGPDGNGNVVATGSGSLNLTGKTPTVTSLTNSSRLEVGPKYGAVFDITPGLYDAYDMTSMWTGPSTFGTGTSSYTPTTSGGDSVGFSLGEGLFSGNDIQVTQSYVSGSPLSDTAT